MLPVELAVQILDHAQNHDRVTIGNGPLGPKRMWIGLQRMVDFAMAWRHFGPEAEKYQTPATTGDSA